MRETVEGWVWDFIHWFISQMPTQLGLDQVEVRNLEPEVWVSHMGGMDPTPEPLSTASLIVHWQEAGSEVVPELGPQDSKMGCGHPRQ